MLLRWYFVVNYDYHWWNVSFRPCGSIVDDKECESLIFIFRFYQRRRQQTVGMVGAIESTIMEAVLSEKNSSYTLRVFFSSFFFVVLRHVQNVIASYIPVCVYAIRCRRSCVIFPFKLNKRWMPLCRSRWWI